MTPPTMVILLIISHISDPWTSILDSPTGTFLFYYDTNAVAVGSLVTKYYKIWKTSGVLW